MNGTDSGREGFSRRTFLSTGTAVAAAAPLAAQAKPGVQTMDEAATRATTGIAVVLLVNGDTYRLSLDPRTTLLDTLREHLGLTGSKKGCDQGQCGACTVHVDGQRTLACLSLAVAMQGKTITTIEGLAPAGSLHPMQQAFIDNDAFQCGYCTPGQIMSAVALVHEGHAGDAAAIREGMSGNLCRCAAYPNIVAAVEQAAAVMHPAKKAA